MKHGILGGTFNPIHNGHLSIASDVQKSLNLDQIVFVPAKVPPLKPGASLFSAEQRWNMTKAAIAPLSFASLSEVDFKRDGPSYTLNTLRDLGIELKAKPNDLFFIVGIDAFLDIKKWWQYEQLFELANFVIVTRPTYENKLGEIITIAGELGFSYNEEVGRKFHSSYEVKGVAHSNTANKLVPNNSADPESAQLYSGSEIYSSSKHPPKDTEITTEKFSITEKLNKFRSFSKEGDNNSGRRGILPQMIKVLTNKSSLNLFILEVNPVDISSSEIRRRIGAKESILGMVPEVVVNLIKEELIA
jgi:nicotinate-nucleotide adenylyltransferase